MISISKEQNFLLVMVNAVVELFLAYDFMFLLQSFLFYNLIPPENTCRVCPICQTICSIYQVTVNSFTICSVLDFYSNQMQVMQIESVQTLKWTFSVFLNKVYTGFPSLQGGVCYTMTILSLLKQWCKFLSLCQFFLYVNDKLWCLFYAKILYY